MKSAVFYGKHDLRIEDYPMPKAGAHDIVIQVKACGVCGTDVHIYDGDKGAAEVTPPTILGHEFAGVIAEVGSEVTECVSIRIATVEHVNHAGVERSISVNI
jgi:threonine dehydrogenase-like Zn-dependent dehydrogenase